MIYVGLYNLYRPHDIFYFPILKIHIVWEEILILSSIYSWIFGASKWHYINNNTYMDCINLSLKTLLIIVKVNVVTVISQLSSVFYVYIQLCSSYLFNVSEISHVSAEV